MLVAQAPAPEDMTKNYNRKRMPRFQPVDVAADQRLRASSGSVRQPKSTIAQLADCAWRAAGSNRPIDSGREVAPTSRRERKKRKRRPISFVAAKSRRNQVNRASQRGCGGPLSKELASEESFAPTEHMLVPGGTVPMTTRLADAAHQLPTRPTKQTDKDGRNRRTNVSLEL
jgi:hypothetical protein